MASLGATRQACRRCRRRKVKCDGLPTCRNCYTAKACCQYAPPKKRGPKPVPWQDHHTEEPPTLASPPTDSSERGESRTLPPAESVYSYLASDNPPSSNNLTPNPLSESLESRTQAAVRIHLDLLAGLLVAAPSDTVASIANHCILLYTQYVFGAVPLCHEATLRATVNRFFVSSSGGNDPAENCGWVTRCFAAENEQERIEALRNYNVLTALCAAVTYVLPESLLPNKHLTAPLFLQAARDTLRIYEDYDLEYPNSSSLSIRLLLSSAIQIATGRQGVAFHILSEAGLIAMRMGLYDERSLEGRDPIEENLLRNAFWQLYVCDKTALVMKGRPVTIHESLFETELTLKSYSRSFIPLFEAGPDSTGTTEVEKRLVEGFHVIRRLWAVAARVIQAMQLKSRRSWDVYADMQACPESSGQLSEAYFEMITSTNSVQTPTDASPNVSGDSSPLMPTILQRQRTSYLLSLHCIKLLVLNTAIQCNMTEIVGLRAEAMPLAMKQVELAQDFLNVIESVPFIHLQAEGEHCAEKIRRVGSLLLELAHTAEHDVVKFRAHQCAMRLIDMLARLNSKASDILDYK
ncbi:hypothetical protein DPV78_004245 [Talaromyces pinophilus]|nr:hypothetical protein DPV78_004245 [Talaromyces pinophilus]